MGSQLSYICSIHDSIFNPLSLSNFALTSLKSSNSPWNLKPSYHRPSFHFTHFNTQVLLFILMVTSTLQPSQSIIHGYYFYYGFSSLSSLPLWTPWVIISTEFVTLDVLPSWLLTMRSSSVSQVYPPPAMSAFFIPFPRFLKPAERSKQKGPNKDQPLNFT